MNDQTLTFLLDDGWREYPDALKPYARCFFKRFETPTRCHCNDDKPGIQVCISASKDSDRYEIRLSGELKDGTWIELHQWAIAEPIEKGVHLIPRLISTWEFINKEAPCSQ